MRYIIIALISAFFAGHAWAQATNTYPYGIKISSYTTTFRLDTQRLIKDGWIPPYARRYVYADKSHNMVKRTKLGIVEDSVSEGLHYVLNFRKIPMGVYLDTMIDGDEDMRFVVYIAFVDRKILAAFISPIKEFKTSSTYIDEEYLRYLWQQQYAR